MHWLKWIAVVALAGDLAGCGRLQTDQTTERPSRPRRQLVAAQATPPRPAATVPGAPSAPSAPAPAQSPATPVTASTASPSVPPSPQVPAATSAPAVEGKSAAPTPPSKPFSLADEARSLRAGLESLRSQFDQLAPEEIRTRLLLAAQSLSEIETRSPALVLWRTALRLEALHKGATPDVAVAKAWLMRARQWVAEEGTGLTALQSAEKALTANRWTDAVAALREAAERLNATDQLNALAQTRASLLSALEAMERHKPAVARAEVSESLKGIDRFLAAIP